MPTKIHKDFHGALSAGFQYLAERYGQGDLEEYLELCAQNIYGRLAEEIKKDGLQALEKYWQEIFSLEEAKFRIKREQSEIKLIVAECPALVHIKQAGYPVYKDFCAQCRIINSVIARMTGLESTVKSDQTRARCTQTFKTK